MLATRIINRLPLGAATTAALLVVSSVCAAQRAAPHVVDYGLPATSEIVPGRLVQWGDWALRAEACRRVAAGVECALLVGNGGAHDLAMCLGDAALLFADARDSSRMSVVRPAPGPRRRSTLEKQGYACLQVAAHGQLTITLRSRAVVARRPSGIGITLVEQVRRPGGDSTLTVRAGVPVSGLGL